jgi:hypothetical protein
MTEIYTIADINCETGEQIERPMTEEELAVHLEMRAQATAQWEVRQAELEAKEQIKASALAKLAELGLTEEEAAALIN